ncbi:putative Dol-P-Man:Man(7)GlcNAc(2)-PP-Dol alpha-1,6-mannosyltransferase [Dufourea novaeangliae]|uniref:Mannosyltransferase n=2 Tax=Dufourea novaeangliae TaxID=178035 RepID=A0A154P401_DUFNO|nr:putative Dol-P-Man:Man(7)GlcNAc(2)-PP-Dol alpha-1,6-mannosyltransferase [Dufourea novaeangliae]
MLWDARVRTLTVPGIVFVALFSFLPHKELRFIIYVFPLLNVSAAAVCHRIWENRAKSPWNGFMALIIVSHLVLNALFSMFLLCVAGSNYPGGLAIAKLHRLEKDSVDPVHVHIDVLTAQTGVSRFTQTNDSWIYSKQENLTIDNPEMLQFTHLLMEAKSKYSPNIKPYLKTHDILDSVDGFSHIALNYNMLPPIRIKTRPIIFIMKRKPNIKYDPKKAKAQIAVKEPTEDNTKRRTETKDVINETTESMEPILGEIMESLEEFEKPLNISHENKLDTEGEQEAVQLNKILNNSDEYVEPLNVEQKTTNLSENDLLHLKTSVQEEKIPNASKIETNVSTETNINVQHNIENTSSSNEKQVDTKSEKTEKQEVDMEKSKATNVHQESSTLKETVRKLIQEKLEAVKLKRDMEDEKKLLDVPEKINAGVKKIIPSKIELQQKMKIMPKELPATVQERNKEHRTINVKESIRNIINQFKEFEKDFIHEDLENSRKETVINKQSTDTSTNLSQESTNVADVTKIEDIKTIQDAKESLKDIINQFKQIKSELVSEEDDQFDRIEATYMDRPISETLMQFSEALKNLIQRRKQEKQFVTSNSNNKKDVSELQSHLKTTVKDSQLLSESLRNLNIQNTQKLEKINQNTNTKDSSNTGTNKGFEEKSYTMHMSNKNVPLNAQNSVNNVSNNIGNHYASKEENNEEMQKNIENDTNN